MIIKKHMVTVYTLEMNYNDVHELYHMMLEKLRRGELQQGVEERFFGALKEHA